MDAIRSIILAMAYIIVATQSSPISVKHYTKRNSSCSERNPIESFDLFFKLIPDHKTRADQGHNASLPYKTARPGFAIEPAKLKLSNYESSKSANSFTKFSYFINVPVAHPYEKYKIIVVTAPPSIKLRSEDTERLVVYIVFHDNTAEKFRALNMPEVYFVIRRHEGDLSLKKNNDPMWIMNSNRTVTGLKSKDVVKSVKFTRKRRQSEANAWV